MNTQEIVHQLEKFGVVPVIAIESVEHALPLADALIEGGLPLAEITFRTQAAGEVIALLNKERPELLVGAGTVLTEEQLLKAKDAGSAFAVAPGLNPAIVAKAQEIGLPFCPGIITPSELEQGLSMEITFFKYFPAEASGGINMIKSVAAPYGHLGVRFMPTGGVTMKNLAEYLSVKAIVAAGGTWIATKDMIAAEQWDVIRDNAKAAVEAVARIRKS